MNPQSTASEIVESTENPELVMNWKTREHQMILKSGVRKSIGDDINSLFKAIDVRTSANRSMLHKSAMKRPVRVGPSQLSGIGISEHVSLKQALRGLSISQASEMAAMKKRLSKQASPSTVSEGGGAKRLYRAVEAEANGSGFPLNAGKGNVVEISLVSMSSDTCQKIPEYSQVGHLSAPLSSAPTSETSMTKLPTSGLVPSIEAEDGREISKEGLKKVNSVNAPSIALNKQKVQDLKEKSPASIKILGEPLTSDREQRNKGHCLSSHISSGIASKFSDSARMSPRLLKPVFRNKSFIKRKVKQPSASGCSGKSTSSTDSTNDLGPSTSCLHAHIDKSESKEKPKASPVSSSSCSVEVSSSSITDTCSSKTRSTLLKSEEKSRSRGKGEFSQSSKSSIGDYSSTTSISEESNSLSGSSRIGTRPHMSKDIRWECINSMKKHHQILDWRHFKLLKKLGCGDIATVYLAELIGSNCLFALKMMDNEFLASRKKMLRAQTEREIMQMLDHPFLPTLYAHFATDKLSCLVMEYCPGGDLHVLRQRQPAKSFAEHAARFYAAEVLLALEYLHMLGVVYRDLKPENILVREDGHIMLSDFDLSLRCSVNPTLLKSTSHSTETKKRSSSPCTGQNCIDPFCLNPSFQISCFTPKLLSISTKARKTRSDQSDQVCPFPQLIVEPTEARSNSFVGTHEYLAPEIIKGEGHGSAVDWWTFGIFLFELLYGKTPFKGSSGNDETLTNVASQTLTFPSCPIVSSSARDLIRGLLVKEPADRLGSVKGAVEIKQHPFFEGLNWALIRCATPPELPRPCETRTGEAEKENGRKCDELQCIQESMKFDMF